MPPRRATSRARVRWELKHRGIHLGTNTETARAVYLRPERLFTHLHIVGPPGSGKTRAILNLYEQLAHMDATVVLFNPKGALGTMARDWSIANGYTDRLIFFDPGDQTHVISYNPLRPNAASIATQAKGVRESLRAAWGQSDFSVTPQLARFLLWALWGARALGLTMIEALDLLRPRSVVRARFLESGSDPYVRDALAYFDTLREARQDELAASSLARLEAFILDPILRRIFGQHARSLEMDRVLRERKLLIVNLEQYQPLRADDVRLLGRLLINDLLAHVFARPAQERVSPVFLLIDEVQTFLTDDLATALDQGRELGLGCVLAHQHMSQVIREDGTGHLADSVRNCARTKLVFGGLSVKEIDGHHVDDLCIDALNPRRIKDEITSLELHPVEETRTSVTRTTSRSGAASYGRSRSKSYSDSRSRGRGETRGRSGAASRQRSLTTGWSNTSGRTEGKGSSYSEGSSSTHSVSEAPPIFGPDGTLTLM